jgi:hypothetical protein
MQLVRRNTVRLTTERARRLAMRRTWYLRPFPGVVVLGAMKSGSTSVYEMMLEHPSLRGAVRKEVHFLDRHFDRGPRWYRAQFPARWPGQEWTAVEATPMYLSFPPAPERLSALGIQPKFIVVLRDPVERTVSHWKHRHRDGRESRTLERVIAEESGLTDDDAVALSADGIAAYQRLILAHGHYAAQLSRWHGVFPRQSFLILESGAFFASPQSTMDDVFAFLGLESIHISDTRPRNAGDARQADPSSIQALTDYFSPLNEQLFTTVGRRFDWTS